MLQALATDRISRQRVEEPETRQVRGGAAGDSLVLLTAGSSAMEAAMPDSDKRARVVPGKPGLLDVLDRLRPIEAEDEIEPPR